MAPWSWPSKASKTTVAQPIAISKSNIMESTSDEDSPRSSLCTAFNQLSLGRTGYITRPELEKALKGIFKGHGQLEFGITVCWWRRRLVLEDGYNGLTFQTLSERWAFWAPRTLDWVCTTP